MFVPRISLVIMFAFACGKGDETAPTTTAAGEGVIMALQHRDLPLHGVQFHPESVLTEGGHRLLANWLEICGLEGAVERSAGMAPLVRHTADA